jgi:signal transduction histidine kinase
MSAKALSIRSDRIVIKLDAARSLFSKDQLGRALGRCRIMGVKPDKGETAVLPLGDLLSVKDPVWVWDVEARRILWANRAGQALWGADTLEDLRGRRFNPRAKSIGRMAAMAAEPAAREWTESLRLPGSARKTPVTCNIQSLNVAGGRPGLIVRAVDGAAQGKAGPMPSQAAPRRRSDANEAALAQIAARMMEAQASWQRNGVKPLTAARTKPSNPESAAALLLRELCHELRNPLNVIIGFAERIRDGDPARAGAAVKKHAASILDGAHLALDLLDDFSARFRPGAVPQAAEPADIKAAIESCLRLIDPLAKQAKLKITKSLGRNLCSPRLEQRALKQILLNVLLNAVRHQKTGGRVSLSARRSRDGVLRLAVSDDGVGMTKREIRAALGQRRNRAVGVNGSGLGLPLVKRLVEAAGGVIAIESGRGKGTTIMLAFPRESLAVPGAAAQGDGL